MIGYDKNEQPNMKWIDNNNENKPTHPKEIFSYCCQEILSELEFNNGEKQVLHGFTEYKIYNENNNIIIFRAHPSYRSEMNQTCNVCSDWAICKIDNKLVSSQILLFINFS